jgi:hypothetical protein
MMAGIKYWDLLQGYNICHYIPVKIPSLGMVGADSVFEPCRDHAPL